MTQEQFIEHLVDVLIYPDFLKLSENKLIFFKNDKWYFEYDEKKDILWCSNEHVWNIFKDKYGLNNNEIFNLLKDMLLNTFNMSEPTPMIENIHLQMGWK